MMKSSNAADHVVRSAKFLDAIPLSVERHFRIDDRNEKNKVSKLLVLYFKKEWLEGQFKGG